MNVLSRGAESSFQLPPILQDEELDFTTVEYVWNLLNTEYVGANGLDRQAILQGAIRGMLGALDDPYTVFFDDTETSEFLQGLNGTFEGVGIEVSLEEGGLTVISPLKDSPAQLAGIQAGDIIVAIDGTSAVGITLDEAVTKIRGPRDSQVVLRVLRDGKETDITVTRDTILVPSVRYEKKEGDVAYIEILQFSEDTDVEFERAAQRALNDGATSIVLDLRYNPGGYLEAAVDVAGWFTPRNTLVVTEREGSGETRQYRAQGPSSLSDIPVVILQNQGSASASEILAGVLRDARSAPIVGEKSFGKGTVQTLEELAGGTSIKFTIARWITPSGQEINGTGIEATVFVEENLETPEDEQLTRALEVAKGL
jgi:carboxyl-terminal processing protease